MNCKNRLGICVFSLGVLMVLLRPSLVYQLTMAESYKRNPTHAWSLLQRLIKKKDDHYDQKSEVTAFMLITEKTIVCSVRYFLNAIAELLVSYRIPWHHWGLYHCFQPGAP